MKSSRNFFFVPFHLIYAQKKKNFHFWLKDAGNVQEREKDFFFVYMLTKEYITVNFHFALTIYPISLEIPFA